MKKNGAEVLNNIFYTIIKDYSGANREEYIN